jgi:hypothetical protein
MWEYMSSILLFQVTMDSVTFILTRGIQEMPMLPCSQGWEFSRIKACTMVGDNNGVCSACGEWQLAN